MTLPYRFDPLYQNYASSRYPVTARGGMVATGSAQAAAAGLEMLRKGGNAVDAAIATAAALTVVEPTANGLGSDAFALVWVKDELYGLNASGYAPSGISREKVLPHAEDGKMPTYGWLPVTVPGAVDGWVTLNRRFGKLSLADCLAPAIRYAEEGYPLSPTLAAMFERATRKFRATLKGPEYDEWFRVFTKDGEAYHFGDMICLPDHARTLRLIAETDGRAFYEGEIAEQFLAQSARDGGYFSASDLADYHATFVEPVSVNYRGYDIWEIPPNGQGIVALMALNILKHFDIRACDDVDRYHKQFEAMKMAFADGMHYITDPAKMPLDYLTMIGDAWGEARAREITDTAGDPAPMAPPEGGTVYLATADGDGNMVSFIQSNYMGFGSGIVLEGYGVTLQNRGRDFSLDPKHANVLESGKRSYHTIIPGFMTRGGHAVGPFGVMGGYMQPQGHVQTVMHMLDDHMNPQMALDAPRWQWQEGRTFLVEPGFDPAVVGALERRGHTVTYAPNRYGFGRGQIIVRLANGVLVGGCETRTDSNIACY